MIEIVWGDASSPERNRLLTEWCAGMLGHELAVPCTTMGVIDGADLIAVMVYHNWSRRREAIEISGAATTPRWLTRPVLRAMFGYPFLQLGCQVIAMRVSERNEHLCRMLPRFGFTGHRLPRLRGRYEDEIVFTLTDDDWSSNGFYGR